MIPVARKWCPDCRRLLPAADFNRHTETTDRLRTRCRVCDAARMKQRRARVGHTKIRTDRLRSRARTAQDWTERAELTRLFLDRLRAQGWTWAALAERLEIDKNTVYRWRAWGSVPYPRTFERLADLALDRRA